MIDITGHRLSALAGRPEAPRLTTWRLTGAIPASRLFAIRLHAHAGADGVFIAIDVVHAAAVRLSVRDTFLPDLAYFTKAQALRLPETHAPFAPTFVLEALSPATAKNDTGRKFAAYESYGVQEYWILDPQKRQHRFYRRNGDMLVEFGASEERIDSASIPGFWIRRSWLNPASLPKLGDCLKLLRAARRKRRH